MAKETKNIKTREECKNEILKSVKHDIFLYSIIFAVVLLIFLPFTSLIGKAAEHHWALGIAMFFSLFFVNMILLGIIIYHVKIMLDVKRHGVTIVTDKAMRLGEEMVRKFPSHHRLANVIYFRDHDKHIYTGTLFELCSHGDEFYLVILKTNKKEKVFQAYNTKFYEIV